MKIKPPKDMRKRPILWADRPVLFGREFEFRVVASREAGPFGFCYYNPLLVIVVLTDNEETQLEFVRHEIAHAALYLTANRAYAEGDSDGHARLYCEEKIACLAERVLPEANKVAEALTHELFAVLGRPGTSAL